MCVMRGIDAWLLGFASFLTVLAAALVPLGLVWAFTLAAAAVVQFVELRSALQALRPAADVAAPAAADLQPPEVAE
jgi:hypothetical protein